LGDVAVCGNAGQTMAMARNIRETFEYLFRG
jgi:hypothetical protein